jgi:hypothetical protein
MDRYADFWIRKQRRFGVSLATSLFVYSLSSYSDSISSSTPLTVHGPPQPYKRLTSSNSE